MYTFYVFTLRWGKTLLITKDIFDSPFLLKHWCSKLRDTFSLDFETTSLNWLDLEVIGFSISDGRQACYVVLGFYDSKTFTPSKYKQELLDILEYYISESKLIIMHNAAYDLMCLKKEGIAV